MVVRVTCKDEEHPIKNEGSRVFSTLYINFSDAQGQITPDAVVISDRNLNSFKHLCMSSLPARMKMIQSKLKEREWSQHFPIVCLWGFFQILKGSLLRSPYCDLVKCELVRDVIDVLVTCKNEEDPTKNESARVVTRKKEQTY